MSTKRITQTFLLTTMTALVALSCSKEKVDMEYPEIFLDQAGAFPQPCAAVFAGAPFTLQFSVSDNVELGSFSLSIHHQFDHHSHTTEAEHCEAAPEKEAVNPWQYTETLTIPGGSKTYLIKKEIVVPASIDTGDYHLLLRLTDKQGWQTVKAVSIKIR